MARLGLADRDDLFQRGATQGRRPAWRGSCAGLSSRRLKAESDFNKRTKTPDGTPTTDAAYVAVSTRTWQKGGAGGLARRRRGHT